MYISKLKMAIEKDKNECQKKESWQENLLRLNHKSIFTAILGIEIICFEKFRKHSAMITRGYDSMAWGDD